MPMARASICRSGRQDQGVLDFGVTEHDLHRYVRRALVLDELFGSARTLTAELGRGVLATGGLPRPLPL